MAFKLRYLHTLCCVLLHKQTQVARVNAYRASCLIWNFIVGFYSVTKIQWYTKCVVKFTSLRSLLLQRISNCLCAISARNFDVLQPFSSWKEFWTARKHLYNELLIQALKNAREQKRGSRDENHNCPFLRKPMPGEEVRNKYGNTRHTLYLDTLKIRKLQSFIKTSIKFVALTSVKCVRTYLFWPVARENLI